MGHQSVVLLVSYAALCIRWGWVRDFFFFFNELHVKTKARTEGGSGITAYKMYTYELTTVEIQYCSTAMKGTQTPVAVLHNQKLVSYELRQLFGE